MTIPAQPPEISVDAIAADTVMLDVREQDEWDAGHAPGAMHIPLGELTARIGDLPDAAPLAVVCRSGGRSGRAVTWLRDNGIDAVNVAGGMQAWQHAGHPLEADPRRQAPPAIV